MEDLMMMKKKQIPSFGNWDFYDELPVTQYFETARQAGLIRGCHFFAGEEELDLFKVPPSPLPYYYHQKPSEKRHRQKKEVDLKEQRKQGRVCDDLTQTKPRAPKAVDEDLYKIPPEFLSQKPKRRVVVSDFWKSCIGLNCVP